MEDLAGTRRYAWVQQHPGDMGQLEHQSPHNTHYHVQKNKIKRD